MFRILAACLAVLPVAASAETLIALGAEALVRFDSATPGTVTTTPLSGSTTGMTMCLDSNPLDGTLFAVGFTGGVSAGAYQLKAHTINPDTGFTTKSDNAAYIDAGSNSIACDIVPADSGFQKIRVITALGGHQTYTSFTSTEGPSTPPAFADGDVNQGKSLSIQAIAYDSNDPTHVPAPTLYGIDLTNGLLVRIGSVGGSPDSASTGKATTIGALGITLADGTANFDISDATGTAYATLTTAAGTGLYTINLSTGAATLVGLIGDGTTYLRGLAVRIPAPATDEGTDDAGAGGGGGALGWLLLAPLLAAAIRRRRA